MKYEIKLEQYMSVDYEDHFGPFESIDSMIDVYFGDDNLSKDMKKKFIDTGDFKLNSDNKIIVTDDSLDTIKAPDAWHGISIEKNIKTIEVIIEDDKTSAICKSKMFGIEIEEILEIK